MSDAALVDLAEAVLIAIVNYWPDVPSTDPDLPYVRALPERQYITVGTPASDCEQLVVAVQRTFGNEGNPAVERIIPIGSGVPWLRAMVIDVQILRCVEVVDAPGGEPVVPSADTIQAEAGAILTDADAVLQCLIQAQNAGELAGCGGMALEPWRALQYEGGFAGGVTRLRINMF